MSKEVSLKNLKHIAYCMSQMPPKGYTYEDFVQFAKWKLAHARNLLMEDPIWEKYADEAIIIEYFALEFERNPDALKQYETSQGGDDDDLLKWMDEQIEKNKAEIEKIRAKSEVVEEFEFEPSAQEQVNGKSN